jgi:hypothetical protein
MRCDREVERDSWARASSTSLALKQRPTCALATTPSASGGITRRPAGATSAVLLLVAAPSPSGSCTPAREVVAAEHHPAARRQLTLSENAENAAFRTTEVSTRPRGTQAVR